MSKEAYDQARVETNIGSLVGHMELLHHLQGDVGTSNSARVLCRLADLIDVREDLRIAKITVL